MNAAERWRSSPLPAVTISKAISDATAEHARAVLDRAAFERYVLLDRASFEVAHAPAIPELVAEILRLATRVTGRSLSVDEVRALRLRPGDYALVRHDRVYDGRPIEVVVDLSPAEVPGAEIHYRHRGQVFFVCPSEPQSITLVERGPTVMSNHTYVSKRHPHGTVLRVVALLRDTASGDHLDHVERS